MKFNPDSWFAIENEGDVPSPALLVYMARVEDNVRLMIAMAGGVERLRPHIKTHKLPDLVRLQLDLGIKKFKCATIAEAEMAAASEVPDVLLAYQPVGPAIPRLLELCRRFPRTHFKTIVDDPAVLQDLSNTFIRDGKNIEVLMDVDCGQHRCGIAPGPEAIALYRAIAASPGVRIGGLHVYDGHIHDHDPKVREEVCDRAFAPVLKLTADLKSAGLPVPRIVAGGTPTFPIHARRADRECSPGTCVFWDAGYTAKVPDLAFQPAAVVFTRVVSKPGSGRLCLDLGHKAIASENPHPRVIFPELPDARAVIHSEEHLVIETEKADQIATGTCLYGIPWHICPTVALHSEVVVVRAGKAGEHLRVIGRERRISV